NENTTMNFEIPGYKERGLIWKFFGRPPDGAEVSLQDRRPLDNVDLFPKGNETTK
ncbi:hypothetical protein L9F63_018402, partial [Diploptera punctata]